MSIDTVETEANGIKTFRSVLRLLCLVPISWVALFFSFVLRARHALGRWPSYDHPDPKQLGFGWHHLIIWLTINLVLASFCLAPVFLVIGIARLRSRFHQWVSLSLFVLGVILILVILFVDPGGFLDWFAD